ncbi:DUF5518 domain-containing protein [Natrononativus amylolyticus]|uniref:DUF5518 domain-containing protein n=1 Tax=Natrononativus amylolyticus TaxID=2963434 RepID=UPI0020CEA3A7|nr:DUF5518 domain-containing protein [Natrononativus amylolyticus]
MTATDSDSGGGSDTNATRRWTESETDPRDVHDAERVRDRRPTDPHADGDLAGRSTLVNGLVGALVTVLLVSLVPLAPLFGGLVAGYLEGRDVGDGLLAGLLSGIAAAIATVFLFAAFGTIFLGFLAVGGGPLFVGGFFFLFLAFATVYIVGLAAVGGALGAYLNDEFGDDVGRL